MHLELPKARLNSFKDFIKHYLMIVLSILTALGLEAWIEHTHHEHAARIASAQIEAEIRDNLEQVHNAHAHDIKRMHALEAVRDSLLRDIKAKLPEMEILRHAKALMPDGLYLDYRWPVMRHEAWDVAVANQSAGWIDDGRLRRYSTVYAQQSAATTTMTLDLPLALDGPRMGDAVIGLESGTLSPVDLLRVTNQMAGVVNEAAHMLDNLERETLAAMPELAHAPAPTAVH